MADELLLIVTVLGTSLAATGYLAHRLRLPPALGYLAVGVAFSPAVKSTPTIHPDLLAPAAHMAVLFILFLVGLELDLRKLRDVLGKTALVLPFDILVPAVAAVAMARVWGWSLAEALALGFAVTTSSTLFGERLSAAFPSAVRSRVLGTLLAEDAAAAGLFGIIAILGSTGAPGGFLGPVTAVARLVFLFILLTAAGLLLVPRLLDAVTRRHANDLLVLAASALVLSFGWLGSWAGSAELGALVAGVAAAEAGSRFVVRNALASLRDVALGLFFFASGLAVDPSSVAAHPGAVAAVAILFVGAKLAVHVPAGLAAGLDLAASLRGALALGSLGELSLIMVAAAQAGGIAHPLLGTAVVGAMLLLLVAVPLLLRAVPAVVRATGRIPERVRRSLWRLVKGLHGASERQEVDPSRRRSAIQLLAANLVILLAWALLTAWAGPRVVARFPTSRGIAIPILVFGIATAVAVPLLAGTYRRYRELVHVLAGLAQDEAAGARARLADAWVLATAVLVLSPFALLAPRALPVLLGGAFLAIIVTVLAWRQLQRAHRAAEASILRVLGHDPESDAFLDRLMEQYPWGVRFAAVAVPDSSPVANQSLRSSRITDLTGATVAVVQRNRREVVNPSLDEAVRAGDTLVFVGDVHQLARAEALVVAHGEALRMTAQSRMATIAEVQVRPGSGLVGSSLGAADLRGRTGGLVVGIWSKMAPHPMPFDPAHTIGVEDRLILLGTPLQVERARLLAEGQEHASVVESRSA